MTFHGNQMWIDGKKTFGDVLHKPKTHHIRKLEIVIVQHIIERSLLHQLRNKTHIVLLKACTHEKHDVWMPKFSECNKEKLIAGF